MKISAQYQEAYDLHQKWLRGLADGKRLNLCGADLGEANLRGANLRGADLCGANLRGANLPCPPMMLMASWGTVSDALTLSLMRYDAANHPHPEKFLAWAEGGPCPYGNEKVQRSANFKEKRELITEEFLALPVESAYQLMIKLMAECCKETK